MNTFFGKVCLTVSIQLFQQRELLGDDFGAVNLRAEVSDPTETVSVKW
jgi:hypothetical protein